MTIQPKAIQLATSPASRSLEPADIRIDANREKMVLGSLILDGVHAVEQCLRLRPEMFALTEHRLLFRRITTMLRDRDQIDVHLLKDELERLGEFSQLANGVSGLWALTEGLAPRLLTRDHAEHLITLWKARSGQALCHEFLSHMAVKEDVDGALNRLQAATLDLVSAWSEDDVPNMPQNTRDALERWLDPDRPRGIPYGLPVLDRLTGGMHPGEMTVVGARNGVGKTSFLMQVAAECGRNGIPVEVFSLEMDRDPLIWHLFVIESGVHKRLMRHPEEASPEERKLVSKVARERVGDWPMAIWQRGDMHIDEIIALARAAVRRKGTRVVMVDYAQNVESDGKEERLRVGKVSNSLARFAKAMGIHVILTSQVKKVPIEHYTKAPTVADLRESSSMGDDANCILLLHRGYDPETGSLQNEGEAYVPKQRHGETRSLPVEFDTRSCTFRNAKKRSGVCGGELVGCLV